MGGKNGPNTLGVNVFTAPGKAMVGERPKPFGEALGFDPITSTLIFGEHDAVLVDAMGTVAEAEALAGWVALHNRNLQTIYITHGHFDHSEGLLKAVELIREQNGQRSVPLHLHPGVFVHRAIQLASGERLPLQDVPSAEALSESGYLLVESSKEEEILDEVFFLSGEIPRTSFERGMGNQVRLMPSGNWEPDPLVLDERFMLAHIRGKGLVIFTGCSHAGVVNICRHAQELFPATPLYALVGGLRLTYPNEDLIDATIAELKKFNLSVIIPGHCTGWRAVHAFVGAFGEKTVDPLAVGTRQSL